MWPALTPDRDRWTRPRYVHGSPLWLRALEQSGTGGGWYRRMESPRDPGSQCGLARELVRLVTGFLEAGEMPEEGILREVKEEIGLDAEIKSYIGMYEFHRKNQLLICYHLTVDSGDVKCPPDEIADHKWVSIETVQPWTAGTGRALRDWLQTRGIEREMFDFSEANN